MCLLPFLPFFRRGSPPSPFMIRGPPFFLKKRTLFLPVNGVYFCEYSHPSVGSVSVIAPSRTKIGPVFFSFPEPCAPLPLSHPTATFDSIPPLFFLILKGALFPPDKEAMISKKELANFPSLGCFIGVGREFFSSPFFFKWI